MGKISATIITYNEEQRLEACLKSLQGIADEIIVVDSHSTDNTVDLCHRYGCKVTRRQFPGYGAQRQFATSLTSHSYVLSLDADEVLSPALQSSLKQLKADGFTHRVYTMTRLNFYCGEPVKHCGWYPDRQIRLFDKRYANWNLRDVAERVIFPDSLRPSPIDGDILHYRCSTAEEFRNTETRHAGIRSRVIAAQSDRIYPIVPYLKGISAFIECYIGQRGFLNGRPGKAISVEKYRSTVLAYRMARRQLLQQ
ncbi:MAG: glycosyltransferase family 2 protein [Muribaculaceae bacterium]|nr:glycosyltransferase family 2 protein [Muribaculaceae bacterium]